MPLFSKLIKPTEKLLKNLAAGSAGAVLASGMITPKEAEGASASVIMRKLAEAGKKISIEEAKQIKELAKKVVTDPVFEENMRALQIARQNVSDPQSAKMIGSGVDLRAYETPIDENKVLKVSKRQKALGTKEDPDVSHFSSQALSEAGLGPKTRTIRTSSGKTYQVQDKLSPIKRQRELVGNFDDLAEKKAILQKDIEPLADEQVRLRLLLESDNTPSQGLSREELLKRTKRVQSLLQQLNDATKRLDDVQNKIRDVENEAFKRTYNIDPKDLAKEYESLPQHKKMRLADADESVRSVEDVLDFPESYLADKMESQANFTVGKYASPFDVHSGNIGFNPSTKKVEIFDTSRFDVGAPEKAPDAVIKAAKERYIAFPEEKKRFQQMFNQSMVEKPKKVAAAGGLFGATQTDAESARQSLDQAPRKLLDIYRDYFRKPVESVAKSGAEFISDTVSMPIQSKEYKDNEKQLLELGISLAADPLNFVSPGLGLGAAVLDVGSSINEDEEEQD